MKYLLLLTLYVVPVIISNAQNSGFFMIYSMKGEATLIRNNVQLSLPRGERFVEGDILNLKHGTVVLLDKTNKRVNIDKQGEYSFPEIKHLFELANSSIGNKYLVFVWDKMAHASVSTSKKGGVVRGENEFLFPPDSGIVFSDTLVFKYLNQEGIRWKLIIRDISAKVLAEYNSAGSLVIITKPTAEWWKPGMYEWILNIPGEEPSGPYQFTIADIAARNAFLTEWKSITAAVSGLPEEDQEQTLRQILELKKWVP